MKFWEAMKEMQENDRKVRCTRWDRSFEKNLYWCLGKDIDLPSGMDWEDVMCEWEFYDNLKEDFDLPKACKADIKECDSCQ